ncbi:MAG: indole-3-glycerol phosphate synthase TrpC [Bryobacterales bacterium]|nr:indole-3-glycerol phosphate synthase TrpC [Bryobacterales bacterium]MBV9399510.1 indole-3-glycerol phosphate synthase TrpC [Bryobacterales bacterium]
MVQAVPDILARIVESKREGLAKLENKREELERRAEELTDFRDFRGALTARRPAIIAEIKKGSPSKGTLTQRFDPAAIAQKYADGGARALSVLTDEQFFQGSLADLETARAAVPLPALRKDFTIDETQVVEAAAHGADAILLIAAILDEREMRRFRELAARYRMAALVEVHDESELEPALASGAEIIGVNNRNLHTFEVTLETSLRLAEKIPAEVLKVSESGLHSRSAIERLEAAGFQAFLIGEHLMKAADPAAALRGLQP